MPFALQPLDWVIIIVVALLIFGPKRLPEFGRSIGKTFTEFRAGLHDTNKQSTSDAPPANPASSENTAFCTHCGAPKSTQGRFCESCGSALN